MFNSISWQQFFYTLLTILGGYYIISFLLLYSQEIIQKFKNRSDEQDLSPSDFKGTTGDLMGKIKNELPNKSEQSIEAQDLNIISESKKQSSSEDEDSLIVGTVSDLLQEIKILFKVIKEGDGSHEDVMPMVTSLLSNYEQLINTKYQDSITLFIHDHLQSEFNTQLSLNTISAWWPKVDSEK